MRRKALTAAARNPLILALIVSNAVSVVLFAMRVEAAQNTRYWFLFWNLLLGWLPVLWAWLLRGQLKSSSWLKPWPVLFSLLWLGFLPNSFYLMSDLIHLEPTGEVGLLFDTVLFLSCIWNGLVAGFMSIYWLHTELIRRRGRVLAAEVIAGVLLMVSFAIYLGRVLRWNTWDVLVNPAGLLFDVSERVINPLAHPQVLVTTGTFFLLLGSMYWVIWQLVNAAAGKPRR